MTTVQKPDFHDLVNRMIAMEQDLARLGMYETMHALNEAKRVAGFERARQVEALMKAQP